ncbi:hypothetical protein HUG15_13135 [Salicibibacter cibarius]|uniref:TRAP transporter large permease subunit n=1 Tax=Salicibibacter cibarius TaxID=2743000 RepID=A0A7T6Z3W5_9BACI|nr:hypothetical protein [Salicibibacter cibarius]QQK76411.1 hypothetical protein HUG15_13135 [Salicibibacter cibarius]
MLNKPEMIRALITVLIAFTYLLYVFVPNDFLLIAFTFFCLLLIITSLSSLKGIPALTIVLLLIAGTWIHISQDGDFKGWFLAFGENASILTLFITVPILSIPVRIGYYLDALDDFYKRRINNANQFYFMSSSTSFLFSVLLNLGSLPLLYQMLNTEQNKALSGKLRKALLRGYVLAVMWSPYFISMALVISYFDVSWAQIFPFGVIIALTGLAVGYGMERERKKEHNGVQQDVTFENTRNNGANKLKQLIATGLAITASIFIIEFYSELSVIVVVSVTAVCAAVIWSLFLRKIKPFFGEFKNTYFTSLPNMKVELVLFATAGFFGAVIVQTDFKQWMDQFFSLVGTNIIILAVVIIGIVVLLSMVGVHSIVTVTLMAVSLSELPQFEQSHLAIAIMLLTSWSLASILSPFSGLTLLTSSLTNRSSFQVGMKENWVFALILFVIVVIVLAISRYVLGIL